MCRRLLSARLCPIGKTVSKIASKWCRECAWVPVTEPAGEPHVEERARCLAAVWRRIQRTADVAKESTDGVRDALRSQVKSGPSAALWFIVFSGHPNTVPAPAPTVTKSHEVFVFQSDRSKIRFNWNARVSRALKAGMSRRAGTSSRRG